MIVRHQAVLGLQDLLHPAGEGADLAVHAGLHPVDAVLQIRVLVVHPAQAVEEMEQHQAQDQACRDKGPASGALAGRRCSGSQSPPPCVAAVLSARPLFRQLPQGAPEDPPHPGAIPRRRRRGGSARSACRSPAEPYPIPICKSTGGRPPAGPPAPPGRAPVPFASVQCAARWSQPSPPFAASIADGPAPRPPTGGWNRVNPRLARGRDRLCSKGFRAFFRSSSNSPAQSP